MVCKKCGAQIKSGLRYCTNCGSSLSPSKRTSRLEGIGWKIGFGVLVLIVGGIVWQKYGQMRNVEQERDALRGEVRRMGQKIAELEGVTQKSSETEKERDALRGEVRRMGQKIAELEEVIQKPGETQKVQDVQEPPKVEAAGKEKLRETYQDSLGIKFVLVPAGEFTMGSNEGGSDEKPTHTVKISKPFYMGAYEVTQGQWQAVMGDNPSNFKGDSNLPVEKVSWEDVQEFIRKVNAKEGGNKYRLPTEAEWEYAARAGSKGKYSFGDDENQLGQYAWYEKNSGNNTHPVGKLKPNAWGLYDMHGNVWEWVQDWYGTYPSSLVTDPAGPSSGSERVFRGGSWSYTAGGCRSANRNGYSPGYRGSGLGFRLVGTAE